jgi:hypothetical protein
MNSWNAQFSQLLSIAQVALNALKNDEHFPKQLSSLKIELFTLNEILQSISNFLARPASNEHRLFSAIANSRLNQFYNNV